MGTNISMIKTPIDFVSLIVHHFFQVFGGLHVADHVAGCPEPCNFQHDIYTDTDGHLYS